MKWKYNKHMYNLYESILFYIPNRLYTLHWLLISIVAENNQKSLTLGVDLLAIVNNSFLKHNFTIITNSIFLGPRPTNTYTY